jgi:methyl-accepting chemotaxis protein
MNKLNIGTRLLLAFIAVLIITLMISTVSIYQLNHLKTISHDIATEAVQRSLLAQRWSLQVRMNWVRTATVMKITDGDIIEQLQKDMASTSKQITEDQKMLETLAVDARGQSLLAEVARSRKIYVDARAGLIKRQSNGQKIQAAVDQELQPLAENYLKAVEQVAIHAKEAMDLEQAQAEGAATTSQWMVGISALMSVVVGLGLAIAVTRSVTSPLSVAVQWVGQISRGDLTAEHRETGTDEVAQLLVSLRHMQSQVSRIVGEVRVGADAVSSASQQIAHGNQDLSVRTEKQASALQETAASMEQLSSTVRQNAENARQANSLSQSTSTVARKAGDVVAHVVGTMQGINDSSRKIADIIGVIDGIAFQTNILALNASVEAARAGEQGRGFAVVASEVRSLAGRSAAAAKEIKVLISESVAHVEKGNSLVSDVGATMHEVVSGIQTVTDLMTEISSASAEQSQGVGQVSEAIGQLDQTTQQNAALVEEMAAAASSMRSQARDLVESAAAFKIRM